MLDIVTGNASAATAGSPTGPGGADTALIFGSINFTVGPTSVEKGERGGQMSTDNHMITTKQNTKHL